MTDLDDIEAAPRMCKVRRKDGGWKWKIRYHSMQEAEAACAGIQRAYRCDWCLLFHIGTIRERHGDDVDYVLAIPTMQFAISVALTMWYLRFLFDMFDMPWYSGMPWW